MNIIGIIPARMGSSRFPGKPLEKINGIPMIGHVYFRSKLCKSLNNVYVATCDKEIEEYILSINGKVIMTKNSHKRASDRTAEALLKIEKEENKKVDIVVMIQGDEPMLYPKMIDESISPFLNDPSINIVNLASELKNEKEINDPNEIKVVIDINEFALYFSRLPIPYCIKGELTPTWFKQVCIIPFKRDYLLKFNNLKPTKLEIAESIDMMRVLENGEKVRMVLTDYETYSVDTIENLKFVENCMKNDELIGVYK
jgi:3-deoxy-manno-octulosonate cytidylyltransferase (CMP-KDO synthetase)